MIRSRSRPPSRWVVLGGFALLAACTPDGPDPLTPPDGPYAMLQPIALENEDTWLSVDVAMESRSTITTDEPFTDPGTGQTTNTLSVSTPVETVSLLGGYDAAGEFVGEMQNSLDADPNADPATQVGLTRFAGDQVTNYNGYGSQMDPTLSDGSTAPNVMADDLFYTEGELVEGVVLEDPTLLEKAQYEEGGSTGGGSTGGGGGDYGGGGVDDGGGRTGTELQMHAVMSMSGTGGQVGRRVDRPDEYTVLVTDVVADEVPMVSAANVRASVSGTGAENGKTRVQRTFKKRGNVYVLDNIRLERSEAIEGGRADHVQTMRYKRVQWHRNRGKDAERLRRRGPPPFANAPVLPPPPPPSANHLGPKPEMAAPRAGSRLASAFTPPSNPQEYFRGNTGKRLVLQHGFAQDWSYYQYSPARREVDQFLRHDGITVTETNYGARFQDQAAALAPQVQGGSILVGHSNGGIVSRELARQRPDLVSGVVTVSSPHHGVPILRVQGVLGNMASPLVWTINTVGCKWFGSRSVCSVFDNGADAIFSRIVGGDGRAVPVWDQERWDDPVRGPYLYGLNNTPESFSRVGIEQHTRQRWLLWRTIGDRNVSCGTSANYYPCGRNIVADLDKWYGGLRSATVVRWTWNPVKLAGRIIKAALAGTVMVAVNAVDALISYSMGGGHQSDGLVPFYSQRYPNQGGAPVVVNGADSHNASAYSPQAVRALRETLRTRFGVPPE